MALGADLSPKPETMPDIARRLQNIAGECGAAEFTLFMLVAAGDRRRLIPVLDTEHPGISETTRLLALRLGDNFARRIAHSMVPRRWAGSETGACEAMQALHWADEWDAPDATATGIALPLMAERGQAGCVIFSGGAIATDMAHLADLHGRCFSIFSAVARLRGTQAAKAPAMSRRETECLRLAAEGRTSEEIAVQLGLSVHTANQYIATTARKLNAVNRMHAVAKALRAGLID